KAARGLLVFFFSSRRRHTRWPRDWSSDVCSSDLDHRARWEEMLDTATSSTATMETGNPVHQTELGLPARINPFDGVDVAKLVAGCRGRRAFEDSLGICIFTTRTRLENVCRALSAATGWYYTVAEAMPLGRR